MKLLILFSLICTPAFAVKLVKQESSAFGTFTQGFELTSNKATYARTSNAFDEKRDYRIGTFSIENSKTKSLREKLDALAVKFETVDKFLKKDQGIGFNDVSGSPGHKQVLVLNGYSVPQESKYYAELDSLFTQLKSLEWKHVTGYEISEDLTKVTELVSGKVKRTMDYPKNGYCDRGTSICSYTGGGKVFVPKERL